MVFPQYLKLFSKITTHTSLTLLENYTSPEAFLEANKQDVIDSIRSTARFGLTYAENKYNAIVQAAKDAKIFGYSVSSNFKRIRIYIDFIRKYDDAIKDILDSLHDWLFRASAQIALELQKIRFLEIIILKSANPSQSL